MLVFNTKNNRTSKNVGNDIFILRMMGIHISSQAMIITELQSLKQTSGELEYPVAIQIKFANRQPKRTVIEHENNVVYTVGETLVYKLP